NFIKKFNNIKDSKTLCCTYQHITRGDEAERYFNSGNVIFNTSSNVTERVQGQFNKIYHSMNLSEENPENGSGYVFQQINYLDISVMKHEGLRGSSYILARNCPLRSDPSDPSVH